MCPAPTTPTTGWEPALSPASHSRLRQQQRAGQVVLGQQGSYGSHGNEKTKK